MTFRSSIPEQRVIIERDPTGRQRVCRATQTDYNPKMSTLRLEHPSDETFSGTFHGDGGSVNVALAQLLVEKERDYAEDKARGDKPREAYRTATSPSTISAKTLARPFRAISKGDDMKNIVSRQTRVDAYSEMKGPKGQSCDQRKLDYWSNRAAANSAIAPRASLMAASSNAACPPVPRSVQWRTCHIAICRRSKPNGFMRG
jgi:hypothetical protein